MSSRRLWGFWIARARRSRATTGSAREFWRRKLRCFRRSLRQILEVVGDHQLGLPMDERRTYGARLFCASVRRLCGPGYFISRLWPLRFLETGTGNSPVLASLASHFIGAALEYLHENV